jgi:hypothetical protein
MLALPAISHRQLDNNKRMSGVVIAVIALKAASVNDSSIGSCAGRIG